ncbi:hypothetical protein BOX15_Mlig033104g1 [Macrostomum lignano]|uniref:Uncharacterized protein n=1 Tax=Macrostomum lignano TaxID=282301 RepID=A0A267EEV0_9PLAT|nr:hypothetical protein BOX15_Mlig033104g1 [Macrostomum lignano]
MGLFSRNRSSTKDNQLKSSKPWTVFRLFQAKDEQADSLANNKQANMLNHDDACSASTSSFEAVATAAAAAFVNNEDVKGGLSNRSNCRLLLDLGNQNYTPEVALSTESHQLLAPTSMPLCRLEAKHNESGSISADEKERQMARFELWQQRRPRFHFGPRKPAGDDGLSIGVGERPGSAEGSQVSGSQADNIVAFPPRYAFVYQDGKFVEREVNRWPKRTRVKPHSRYRVQEPFASRYGRRYKRRMDNEEHVVSLRHRLIYQNPIYKLPRRIMEENKHRLITRHSLKDSIEGSKPTGGPQKIEIGEREQTRMIKKLKEKHHRKEAEVLVNYAVERNAKTKASQRAA